MALLGLRAREGGPKFQEGSAWETPKALTGAPGQSRREPTGRAPRGARGVCLGPGGRGSGRGPRLRPARQGPPLADASLPFRRGGPASGPDSAGPPPAGFGFWSQRRPPLPQALRLGSGPRAPFPQDPHPPRGPSSHPPPLPAPGTRRGRRGRRRVVECAPRVRSLSRRRRCALWRGAGLATSGPGCGGGRAVSARRGDTAALRPATEEQPRSSQPREGGWAAEWGGVSGRWEWLPRRLGGSPPSASPTPAGSPPRPLLRPRTPPWRVGSPRRADLATRARGRPRPSLPLESKSWPGRFGGFGSVSLATTSPPK